MKITFDSNVWRGIVSLNTFSNNNNIHFYKEINKAIRNGKIEAYLSETVFTIEAIQKTNRKTFFGNYTPLKKYNIYEKNNVVSFSSSIEPNIKKHPGNHYMVQDHYKNAINLGLKIINNPRIGTIKNPEIKDNITYLNSPSSILFAQVSNKIEELKAGFYQIKKIGLKYSSDWNEGIKMAPESENPEIIKAISEWADGDSIASHIAIKGDYFCTLDKAKKAGSESILNKSKIEKLSNEFNIRIATPEELYKLIK